MGIGGLLDGCLFLERRGGVDTTINEKGQLGRRNTGVNEMNPRRREMEKMENRDYKFPSNFIIGFL